MNDSGAQRIMDEFHKLNITLGCSATLLHDAYRIAIERRRSVYDALYIALRVKENCRFVTADERLVNAISTSIPNLIWLPNW
ncbi:MAG: type II toxin-antitoxin system VapC family toxin [Acidobacteria bacterium]|nr:type II toxin-antitoxin system VapC family toxin [Acidobacteriota bacterium]